MLTSPLFYDAKLLMQLVFDVLILF